MPQPAAVPRVVTIALAPLLVVAAAPPPAAAPPGPPYSATYADLADLAAPAPLVLRAEVRSLARVDPARAAGVRAGHGRFYVEARTQALLAGAAPIGGALAFLADLPLDARGRPPALKKRAVLLFARPVAGSPEELALVAPDALLFADPATEARLRGVLTALLAPDAPARITGVRESINVPGALAGQSDTQVFLATADRSAASLTIEHQPGAPARWGASFSELTADIGNPPRRDTLAWYRLACFLPRALPGGVDRSDSEDARARAARDYKLVIGELGDCPRERN